LPREINPVFEAPQQKRLEVVILGAAGQRVVTAGELLCMAGLFAGQQATQKNDYPITVLTGHSVSEVILSPEPIHYTGMTSPWLVVALADEGVKRRKRLFAQLGAESTVLKVVQAGLPETKAQVWEIDFKSRGIKEPDWALASLAVLASENKAISLPMLHAAVEQRFQGKALESSKAVIERAGTG
jgi:Pyruvate/2-oxoacid:ferredoxin oxidoreductase gamma subunit